MEYQQYLQSLNIQNSVDPAQAQTKEEETHAGPGGAFVQWLQLILGFTTKKPETTTVAVQPPDCEECTVCGRSSNGTKIVGN